MIVGVGVCVCAFIQREEERKVEDVYKRNSVIERHLALSVCERARESKTERKHNIPAFHLPQGQWCIPPDAQQHYSCVCGCVCVRVCVCV